MKIILLSINPEHAKNIYAGVKKAELRKSFDGDFNGFVCLYETLPEGKITGGFFTSGGVLKNRNEIEDEIIKYGINRDRVNEYFKDRDKGWIIPIDIPIKFNKAIDLKELKNIDHLFYVPQSYISVNYNEPVFKWIKDSLINVLKDKIIANNVETSTIETYKKLIYDEVKPYYNNINEDFIDQISDVNKGNENAFSTKAKVLLEFCINDCKIGFSVITEKYYGSMKTGPTILIKQFRGLGLSSIIRDKIFEFCSKNKYKGIYCTCPSNKPEVIGSLMNKGFEIQAVLKYHLSDKRNELVFSNKRAENSINKQKKIKNKRYKIIQLSKGDMLIKEAIKIFKNNLKDWYFKAPPNINTIIINTIDTNGEINYSDKPRALFCGKDIKHKEIAVILCTAKRSDMLKMNIVTNNNCKELLKCTISAILDKTKYRKYYCTIPTNKLFAIDAFLQNGFNMEGILEDPFNNGINHICLGKINKLYNSGNRLKNGSSLNT